ncbi:MAG: GntR family transcriptional regulator [Firmicutes bacterium]|nr:GntR family transcriptional regulator [Bacillota bacterium]
MCQVLTEKYPNLCCFFQDFCDTVCAESTNIFRRNRLCTVPCPPNYDEQNREQSVSVRIYQELKRKILDAEYKPGALLTEGKLAVEYGVSRIPVRFAVQKLSGKG